MKLRPDEMQVRFSTGKSKNLGRAKNTVLSWPEFKKRFKNPGVSPEKFARYQKMSQQEQGEAKSFAGWFFRTQVTENEKGKTQRTAKSGQASDIVTYDFDYATPEFLDQIEEGLVAWDIPYIAFTTRSHTPEKPRLRIIVLMDSPVSNDLYPAVSRILAQRFFDPEMVMVDKVSFRRAQMMFFPTRSVDQEFRFFENKGSTPFDWNAMLDDFEKTADWRVITNLPKAAGEQVRETAEKAENPLEKKGIVGNFCRAYPNIIDAYDKYIPGLYVPTDENSEKPRYTYTQGHSVSGMVVEDDGLFTFSHHGSDPTSDMLVNAFDGIRIHLFGDLDNGIDPDTPMKERPSFKAMRDHIEDDPLYRAQQAQEKYDLHAMFDDIMEDGEYQNESDDEDEEDLVCDIGGQREPDIDQDPEDDDDDLVGDPNKRKHPEQPKPKARKSKWVPPEKGWHLNLEINAAGKFENNLSNAGQIIQSDPRTGPCVEYNIFLNETVTRRPIMSKMKAIPVIPINDKISGDVWQDTHSNALRFLLEAPNGPGKPGWGLKVSDRDLDAAIDMAGRHYPFHPVREMLESGSWDGLARAESMFIRYLGCPDHPYYRETCRKFLIAAVARVYEPGHKFDFVPILEGFQGKRKSTFIRILAMDWFEELKGSFGDEKRLVEQMMGAWILELPELSAVTRSIIEEIKAFISASHSTVRLSYGRRSKRFDRQCVFMGSTNEAEYLIDHTGNRRWWPIFCSVVEIDTEGLKKEVQQIWYEAVVMYREMRAEQPHGDLPLYLTDPASVKLALELQEDRRQQTDTDVWGGIIQNWLDTPVEPEAFDEPGESRVWHMRTCVGQLWKEALGQTNRMSRTDMLSVGKAIRKIGWTPDAKVSRFGEYGVTKTFTRPEGDLDRVKAEWAESDIDSLI